MINQTTLKLDLFHQKLSPQRATKADNDDRKRCLQHVGFMKLLKMKQKQTNKKPIKNPKSIKKKTTIKNHGRDVTRHAIDEDNQQTQKGGHCGDWKSGKCKLTPG